MSPARPLANATVLIVPGLRDHVADHWQTLLAARAPRPRIVPPLGRENLDCAARVAAIEREARAIEGPLILVGHRAGVPVTVHWAMRTMRPVLGALLAAPPDLETPLPDGYPTMAQLAASGWLARIFQHEIDHLDGVLFTDRLTAAEKLRVRSKLAELEQRHAAR